MEEQRGFHYQLSICNFYITGTVKLYNSTNSVIVVLCFHIQIKADILSFTTAQWKVIS